MSLVLNELRMWDKDTLRALLRTSSLIRKTTIRFLIKDDLKVVRPEHVHLCEAEAITRIYRPLSVHEDNLFRTWLHRVIHAQNRIVQYAAGSRYFRLDLLFFLEDIFTSQSPYAKLVLQHYWNHERVWPHLTGWLHRSEGKEKARLEALFNLMMVN